jgi:hypothetical protein
MSIITVTVSGPTLVSTSNVIVPVTQVTSTAFVTSVKTVTSTSFSSHSSVTIGTVLPKMKRKVVSHPRIEFSRDDGNEEFCEAYGQQCINVGLFKLFTSHVSLVLFSFAEVAGPTFISGSAADSLETNIN